MFIYKLVDYVSANYTIVKTVLPDLIKGTELSRDVSGILGALVAGFKAIVARLMDVGASAYLDASVVKGKESHCSFIMSWQMLIAR